MTGGEFFAQAHICPVCHDDHGGPDCKSPFFDRQPAHLHQQDGDFTRPPALCWYGDCDAALIWADGIWICPEGHALRQYEHLSKRTRDRITYTQTDPSMHRRYFGDRP